MRQYAIKDGFGIDRLALMEAPEPEAGPGQVRVRIKAVSLNYRDLLMVEGKYNPNLPLPLVPCSDGAGEVVEAGPGVTRFKVGDRVTTTFFQGWIKGEPTREELRTTLGGPLAGTLREFAVLGEEGLVHTPAHLTDAEAATLPCAALTAWTALVEKGQVKAGDVVLTQGTGGVAIFALQFARLHGARVIALTGSPEKAARLIELGASEVINYKETPGWSKRVKELTDGAGVDQVIEVGGAATLEQSLQSIRPAGTVSMIGVLSGTAVSFNLRFITMNSARIQGILVGPRVNFEAMNRAIGQHQLRPVIDRVFPFEQAREALRHLQSGRHFGKVVVEAGAPRQGQK